MAIYDILNGVKDIRESGVGICTFNGFLEDYLSIIEADEGKEEVREVLETLFEEDHNLKVAVDLHLNINKEAIANQIIRYKDSFKLPHGTICCPYVVYGKFDDYQKAVILTLGDKEEYVIAKALYYVMSEPENEYEGTRNEIIAMSVNKDTIDRMMENVIAFFMQNQKAGIVQRRLDSKVFENYDEMYEMAKEMGSWQQEHLQKLLEESKNREKTINEIIEKSNDVKIDIDQDGTVVIYHSDQEAIDTAVSLIERIVKKAEVGEIYDGTIARVNDNYAFVTLFEGTDGFLHISDWSYERTSKMQDVCKVGDVIKVKVTKVDDKGKVNVSRKALLPKPVKKEEKNEKNEK